MIKKTKIVRIELEGIDKSCKSLLLEYIKQLSWFKLIVHDRGLISSMVFSDMYNRNYTYDPEEFRNTMFVYLTVDRTDWKVRCKLCNEPEINYDEHLELYNKYVSMMIDNGFKVLTYNTTHNTVYDIAKDIIEQFEKMNINN